MRTLFVALLTVFAVSAVFFASADAGKAQPTECEITTVKVAEGRYPTRGPYLRALTVREPGRGSYTPRP